MTALFVLLRVEELSITPGVYAELEHGFQQGRLYAKRLFDLISAGGLRIVALTPEEAVLGDSFPAALGVGEREAMAVAC